jgi:hypothetical protein
VSTQSRPLDSACSTVSAVPPVNVYRGDRYRLFSEEVRTATLRRISDAATFDTCNPRKGSTSKFSSNSQRP